MRCARTAGPRPTPPACRSCQGWRATTKSPPALIAPEPGQSIAADLSARGNGACFLGAGWSALEPWGVWSIGSRSHLVFPYRTPPRGPLRIQLCGRVFNPPRDVTIHVQAGSRVLTEYAVRLDRPDALVELPPIHVDAPGAVRLTLEISGAGSPAELGAGADVRPLGFGLERLTIHH